MASISIQNVSKIYSGNVKAVDDLFLEIEDKEFLVLVGPSGCGKSSTLRMLAGLEDVTKGDIFIGGNRVNDLPPKDRDIAMVFQNYALYPHMSVFENMAFGLKMRKTPKAEIKARVLDAAERLEIEHLLHRRPKALSGGERQRVALGRAMVRKPAVFLLDEPLSNLDAKLRAAMRVELIKLHQRLETTFVYVTHDQTEAMTMGKGAVAGQCPRCGEAVTESAKGFFCSSRACRFALWKDFKEKAAERLETSFYHESRERNAECARAIDNAINASCYETYRYNLELAAMSAIQQYGFARVNAVLAHNLQTHNSDGRYSRRNKDWAQGFSLADEAFRYSYMNAHPILLEDFTKHARTLYDAVDAERFLLPGHPEKGTAVHGYNIFHSIAFDDQRGFAMGLNPDASAPLVCWQFTIKDDGARDFYWGTYTDELAVVADNYMARVMVHMDGGAVREVYNPLAAAEMSKEQNYNQINGAINNEKARLDLTDGQTHEEVEVLTPQTLPREKPSVLAQIREARKAPSAPHKEKSAHGKDGPEL